MNNHLKTPISLAAFLLLFTSAATAQTVTDLPKISAIEVLKSGVYPRELTSVDNRVFFTAQDSSSSEWHRRYLWSSTGSLEETAMAPSAKDAPIIPGVVPAFNYWETQYARPGREMVSLGDKLLLSTFDGVALFNPTSSSYSFKPVKVPREWSLQKLPLWAPDSLNLYRAGNNAYTVRNGELFGITAEPLSVSQLTTVRSNNSGFVSAFAPAGSSIIYGVTKPSLLSMLYSFNGQSINQITPSEAPIGVPRFAISGMPEVVDVSGASPNLAIPGAYLGRFTGTGSSLVHLNLLPPLQSTEQVIYRPESFRSSDTPFLHVMTRDLRAGTRLYRGTVIDNNSVTWSELWNGVENLGSFGYISMVKVFQGNVFLKYSMGQTIVVRADGSWRYVDASDPDSQFVKLVLDTTERVKVGRLWFFSSADGKDFGVAKEVPAAKPSAWNPKPKSKVAAAVQTPGVTTGSRSE